MDSLKTIVAFFMDLIRVEVFKENLNINMKIYALIVLVTIFRWYSYSITTLYKMGDIYNILRLLTKKK